MKVNRKTSIISLFVAGTILFSSVALADVIIGDGYNDAKQALKNTTKVLTKNIDSFSANVALEIKCDGKLIESSSEEMRIDFKNQREENTVKRFNTQDGETSSYNYHDNEKTIYKDNGDGKYYQYNFAKEEDSKIELEDPFDEDIAKDIERIADAMISNMKHFIQVKDTENGGKLYYGNLENSQIPALVNALSSVAMKYSLLDSYDLKKSGFPQIKDDLYCSELNGKASESADGLLDSFAGEAILTGKDKDGKDHIIEISCSMRLFDLNSTVVVAPFVDPENITTRDDRCADNNISKSAIGTYKSNIITTKDDVCTKVGERVLTITAVDGDTVTGTLAVTGTDEDINISFTANRKDKSSDYAFDYTSPDGTEKHGVLQSDAYVNQYNGDMLFVHLDCEFDEDNNWGYTSERNDGNFFVVRTFE
ncbi:MAG: hypothetical protein PUB42_03865 [Firmicutes bacterium]|nr:hypothetical protein [Bacillota bacterium]